MILKSGRDTDEVNFYEKVTQILCNGMRSYDSHLHVKDIAVKKILKEIEEDVKNGKAEIFLLVLQLNVNSNNESHKKQANIFRGEERWRYNAL